MGITEEELYNMPTAEYIHRRGGFLDKRLTVYHAAFQAFGDLKEVEVISQSMWEYFVHLIIASLPNLLNYHFSSSLIATFNLVQK